MPILKFSVQEDVVTLDKFRLVDITDDRRTRLLNKENFLRDEYKIDKDVYLILNDIFFKVSRLLDNSKTPINAMLIRERDKFIVIVPSRSYVFWNGKSVEATECNICGDLDITKILEIVA